MQCPWYWGGGIPEDRRDFQSPHSALTHVCRDPAGPLTHVPPQTCGPISLVDSGATRRPRLGNLAVVGAWASGGELGWPVWALKVRGEREDDICGG